jgi:hypothetical protein
MLPDDVTVQRIHRLNLDQALHESQPGKELETSMKHNKITDRFLTVQIRVSLRVASLCGLTAFAVAIDGGSKRGGFDEVSN